MEPELASEVMPEVASMALLRVAPKLQSDAELRQSLLQLEAEHEQARRDGKSVMCQLLFEASRAVGKELARRVNPAAARLDH